MYHIRKLPEPFQNKAKKAPPSSEILASIPIEAKEKTIISSARKELPAFPLTTLLLLHLFSNKKGDE